MNSPRFDLNHNVLGDDNRISGGRDQAAVAADDALLVENAVIDLRAFLNLRVLHDDGVFDDRALGDLHAAEEDGVDDRAFDHAAVGDQRVGAFAVVHIAGRQVIAHLRIHGAVCREELTAHVAVEQRHVEVEVGLDGVDLAGQPLVCSNDSERRLFGIHRFNE